jgi:two-component system chemotaxis sensor kinase CheA
MKDEDRTLVVLRPSGGDVYALAVDRIHDHEELVVKPAAPAVMATGLYAGTTLADDGSPILLFDPSGLAEVGGVRFEAHERTARVAEGPAKTKGPQDIPVLLFRGLDGGRRALRLAVVDRIEEVAPSAIRKGAGQLRVQLGEAILPLAGVAGDLPETKLRVFRLNDGVQEVIDLSMLTHKIVQAKTPGEISGVTLINDEPAELVDAHWLFATYGGSQASLGEPSICRLPDDDPWMQNMLRPIVEAAGYRVVGSEDPVEADLVIASVGAEVGEDTAGRTIWLRSEPETEGKQDKTIYRYDRAGLLMALKTAGAGSGTPEKRSGRGK